MSSDENEGLAIELFQEPIGYYELEKPASYIDYTLTTGQTFHLRLVGHNPLLASQGHHLWNGARILTKYLQNNPGRFVHSKNVLELGAGAGLPSLAAAVLGASKVVVTDYPDEDLIVNLKCNIDTCRLLPQPPKNIVAAGYLWGSSVAPLLSHLPQPSTGFDVLLLADLLFNHSCHEALVSTICGSMARSPGACALVFFTPYRPWLFDRDMAFFELCRERGLEVLKVVEEMMEKVMFEDDRGDELLRRTVFGYEIKWK